MSEKFASIKKHNEKYFSSLLDDVKFVISGFKNPLRSELRKKALEMGAIYHSDWNATSTHLVCAFTNTPKFKEVKGKGKIVSIDWIETCYKNRKRYPWRRFALEEEDKDEPESEEEIEEKQVPVSSSAGEGQSTKKETFEGKFLPAKYSGKDKEMPKKRASENIPNQEQCKKNKSEDPAYDVATDEDDDLEIVDTTDYPMPCLIDVFKNNVFHIDDNLKDRGLLERYIIAYNGTVNKKLDGTINYHITNKPNPGLTQIQKNSKIKAVTPKWIWDINKEQKWIPSSGYCPK